MASNYKIGKTATSVACDAAGMLRVTYHDTDVVTVEANGRITLDHGGWCTVTTKARMNQTSNVHKLGFYVSSRKGKFIVEYEGIAIPFVDNVVVLESTASRLEQPPRKVVDDMIATAVKTSI